MRERVSLIVDDEPEIRAYLRLVLECKGIQSVEAENAAEALRILQKLGSQIDLLITDIQMPGDMDGVDLAYSANSSFPTLPVILISGIVDKPSSGFTFVQKPFTPEAILEAVKKVISAKA